MIEIIQSTDELESLEGAWNNLANRFPTPLLRHEWFVAAARAFCPPGRLSVVIAHHNGTLTGIAPLVAGTSATDSLELLGGAHLYEPSGFLYQNEEGLRELVSGIRALRRPVFLNRLAHGSREVQVLSEACRTRALFSTKTADGAPWLPISGTWTDFEAQLSSHRRYTLRRARKRAEELGPVTMEILSPLPEDVDPMVEQVMKVEQASWKSGNGTAMTSREPIKQFFESYCRAAAHQKLLRTCMLRINGQAVAFQLALQHAGRFWVLKIGYDEAYARCSPGILLMHETIRHAFEQGLEAYEFLGTDESWIHMWTDQLRAYVSVRAYPLSLPSLLGLAAAMPRSVIRKVLVGSEAIL